MPGMLRAQYSLFQFVRLLAFGVLYVHASDVLGDSISVLGIEARVHTQCALSPNQLYC
jgi:hypothetical protein